MDEEEPRPVPDPLVSVVVVSHDVKDLLLDCLTALHQATDVAFLHAHGSSKDDALVWVLEAGSILFTLLLLTLELIHAIHGRLTMRWIDDFGSGAALIACQAAASRAGSFLRDDISHHLPL